MEAYTKAHSLLSPHAERELKNIAQTLSGSELHCSNVLHTDPTQCQGKIYKTGLKNFA